MREMQWLKRLMTDLGRDREAAKERGSAGNQQESEYFEHSSVETDDEDDKELDSLLQRAMLLLRSKTNTALQRRAEWAIEVADSEEDESDNELDQLLHRALLLLQQRLAKDGLKGAGEPAVSAEDDGDDDDDDELDRLLQRAMLLSAERRRWNALDNGALGSGRSGVDVSPTSKIDPMRLRRNEVTMGSGSRGLPSLTDCKDDDEEDDELDRLLRPAMTLLHSRLRAPANNQKPDGEQRDSTPLVNNVENPMGWRKALRLQQQEKLQLKQMKMTEVQKRQRDEAKENQTDRKPKRARHLHELQQGAEVVTVPAEAQASKFSSSDSVAHEKGSIATTSTAEIKTETAVKIETAVVGNHLEQQVCANLVPNVSLRTEHPRLVDAAQLTSRDIDNELLTLRASNAKLSDENMVLKQQLEDSAIEARMVLLLQEQVQRLQQRELELMRALARCSGNSAT
ncbi:uncharacterized protein IUM83_04562 [Phytophthora cinnamomi]|uniref:uncharacterized protein n=1 Tax=Phytophthora cinnamomi TaxID=4785 RepID=UPI003559818E|nr:hypothetical protein IUM83_04562 [Phytophthora cinnamomi]